MNLSFDNINDLQLYLLEYIKESGDIITTREQKTLEVTSLYLRLNNPLKRCTTLKSRKWSLPFALGELAWHMAGSNKLGFIEYYAKQWKNFSEDGSNISNSCYGNKIFSNESGISQWEKIIRLFKKDIYTRRGVFDLYTSHDSLEYELKDVSCTCSIQFLYRKNHLDATVYMRSNDIIWGLPNDIFFFTFLQEMLAKELNVSIGVYNHIVGSLHLYDRHFNLADEILRSKSYIDFSMDPITNSSEIEDFLIEETRIRTGVTNSLEQIHALNLSLYWKRLLEILFVFATNKKSLKSSLPSNNPYSFMLAESFFKKSISQNK